MINLKFSLFFVIILLINIQSLTSQSADCENKDDASQFLCNLLSTARKSSQISGPNANCIYGEYNSGYGCQLTLINADESTPITGHHLDQKSDKDVKLITTSLSGSKSTKIPTYLCENFSNIEEIELSNVIELEIIDGNSFKTCKNLKKLDLRWNKIKKLPENVFASLSKLEYLGLYDNELTKLDKNSFANLTNLRELYLCNNYLKFLPDGIFAPLINLEVLFLRYNELTKLHYSWFGDTIKKLNRFNFDSNNITAIDKRIIDNNPELMVIEGTSNVCVKSEFYSIEDTEKARPNINVSLKDCFSNYKV